jgi:hypothetical protein
MLAKILFGFRRGFRIFDELALQFPTAVLAAGALDRALELPQLALVWVYRHDISPIL